MLAAKKTSQKKMIIYLAIVGGLTIAVIGYYIYIRQDQGIGSEVTTASGDLDMSRFTSVGKQTYGIEKLRNFDTKIFQDLRFRTLLEFPKNPGGPSPIGKKNPFKSNRSTSSAQVAE